MNALLYWISSRLPCRIIAEEGSVYLERYYLFTLLGWRFYLHRFVGSDPDRGLHDHPWARAFSIILAGWYWEETRSGTRKVRWFNALTGDTFHRVVLPGYDSHNWQGRQVTEAVPCWTLFFHRAKYVKEWGFWRDSPVRSMAGNWQVRKVFIPYVRTRSDEMPDWWNRVPNGRNEPRRACP